ncbi:flavin reductase family protein [Antarcticimicrobium sediminis]|uniref:Flavin reductase family protein n=1 Tax=Antarcticimicrobium sediminis TaxID=2546227 RepID=A0A4R5ENL9_9RHOB|nr:flavin reductase family protein [Antarcticimicrobium sediminis]TDE36204.1 flavin reductase family protein [Antarcticimicrobium sediminis]
MFYDCAAHPEAFVYKLLTATVTPRPIAWVTTRSVAGVDNAAPYSFFNVMGHEPPTVALGLLRDPVKGLKDTAENISASGEFVVNLVARDMAEQMNTTAIDAPRDVSEVTLAGLDTMPSSLVAPPRLAQAPVSFECRLLSAVMTGPKQMVVIGRVVAIHIADRFLLDAERGHVDTPALDLIARMHGSGWYKAGGEMFQMTRLTYPPEQGS